MQLVQAELITFVLGLGTLTAIILLRERLLTIPTIKYLLAAFGFQLVSLFFTNAEAFVAPVLFNSLEHISQFLCAVSLFVWVNVGTRSKRIQ